MFFAASLHLDAGAAAGPVPRSAAAKGLRTPTAANGSGMLANRFPTGLLPLPGSIPAHALT